MDDGSSTLRVSDLGVAELIQFFASWMRYRLLSENKSMVLLHTHAFPENENEAKV
jgi:hypothetical protein